MPWTCSLFWPGTRLGVCFGLLTDTSALVSMWNVSSQLLTLSLIFQQHSPTVPRNASSLSSEDSSWCTASTLPVERPFFWHFPQAASFAGHLVRSCPHQLQVLPFASSAVFLGIYILPIGRNSRITICCFLIASSSVSSASNWSFSDN